MSDLAIERLEAYLRKNPYNKQAREHLDRLKKQRAKAEWEEDDDPPPSKSKSPPPKSSEMNQNTRYLTITAVFVGAAVLGYTAFGGKIMNPLEAARNSYGKAMPVPSGAPVGGLGDAVYRPQEGRPPYRCWDRLERIFVDPSFCTREHNQ
jgi:hypothetical protein